MPSSFLSKMTKYPELSAGDRVLALEPDLDPEKEEGFVPPNLKGILMPPLPLMDDPQEEAFWEVRLDEPSPGRGLRTIVVERRSIGLDFKQGTFVHSPREILIDLEGRDICPRVLVYSFMDDRNPLLARCSLPDPRGSYDTKHYTKLSMLRELVETPEQAALTAAVTLLKAGAESQPRHTNGRIPICLRDAKARIRLHPELARFVQELELLEEHTRTWDALGELPSSFDGTRIKERICAQARLLGEFAAERTQ